MGSGNDTLVIYPFLPPVDDGGAEYYLNFCAALSRTRTVHVVIYDKAASEELSEFLKALLKRSICMRKVGRDLSVARG